jgi:LSU ribosomal protein L10AE
MGDQKKDYDFEVRLVTKQVGQIRHNALEAARVIALKQMTAMVGNETDFFMFVTKYPHHVIRENKMMAFAGADRLQDGMRLSFGKPIGTAARITKLGDLIMGMRVKKDHLEFAKKALKVASSKLPLDTEVVVLPLKEEKAQ